MSNEDKLDELLSRVQQLQDTFIAVSRQHLLQTQRILEILEPQGKPLSEEHKQLGYPALFLDAVANKVLVKKSLAQPLEEILHGAEYHLFRHIIELLQIRETTTHWIWGFIIWPEWCKDPPNSPDKAFGTQCSRLRKQVEKAWKLGPLLGKGTRHSSNIPIEIVAEHFSTEAKPEGSAHPVWSIFLSHDQFQKACKTQQWEQAHRHVNSLLEIDPENWAGNIGLCWLVIEDHVSMNDPLVQKAMTSIHKKLSECQQAFDKIKDLPEKQLDQEQYQRIRERLDGLTNLSEKLPPLKQPLPSSTNRKPWRTREEFAAWLNFPGGLSRELKHEEYIESDQSLQPEERKVVKGIRQSLQRYFTQVPAEDIIDYLQQFVGDLAFDKQNWPDERLPGSKKAFMNRLTDHMIVKVFNLSDDDQSSAITKAQNLRRLWSRRAILLESLGRKPTVDELYQECQKQNMWSQQFFDNLIKIEEFCQTHLFDEAYYQLDNNNDGDMEEY